MVEVVTLDNGLRIAIVRGQHLSRASIVYLNRVGARFEAPAMAGLSHFLEHMLHRGTPRHPSAHALAGGIEEIGAVLEAATGVESGSLSVTAPPEMLLDAADILAEVACTPLFGEIEVERGIVHEELLEDRDERGRLVDPDGLSRGATFGSHPLGQPIVGTAETLSTFDHTMLSQHHRRHYTTHSGVLAVAGRLPERRTLLRRLGRAFGALPRGGRIATQRFKPTRVEAPQLCIVRTASSQTSLRVSAVGPGRKSRRAVVAELMLRLIDDGNATRLYARLCDALGLCYDVSAGFEPYDEVGFFDVAAESHESATPRVLTEVLAMLFDLGSRGPHQAEMEKAARRAVWQAQRAWDQPEALAEQAASGLLFGGAMSPDERAAELGRVSGADVRKLAAAMFHPRQLVVTLVGPVSRATEKAVRAALTAYESGFR